jgi:Competence-damaged protein/Family of unknown function (DUF6328)
LRQSIATLCLKNAALGVPPSLISVHSAVSAAEVAKAMASGTLERCPAHFAVAITGVAGPEPDDDGNPAGLIYIGMATAVHALGLGFVALSTVLLMAPAAYHRIVFGGDASDRFLETGSRFLLAATMTLAIGIAADVHVVMARISQSVFIGAAAAALSLSTLIGLWHVSPSIIRL